MCGCALTSLLCDSVLPTSTRCRGDDRWSGPIEAHGLVVWLRHAQPRISGTSAVRCCAVLSSLRTGCATASHTIAVTGRAQITPGIGMICAASMAAAQQTRRKKCVGREHPSSRRGSPKQTNTSTALIDYCITCKAPEPLCRCF